MSSGLKLRAVEEIREERAILCETITKAIINFSNRTGVKVEDVTIPRYLDITQVGERYPKYVLSKQVEVDLEII